MNSIIDSFYFFFIFDFEETYNTISIAHSFNPKLKDFSVVITSKVFIEGYCFNLSWFLLFS